MPSPRFAVYMHVGPSEIEKLRVADLVESILFFEPDVENIVLVDNSLKGVRPGGEPFPEQCTVLSFLNQDHSVSWLGAGCVSNFATLSYIRQTMDVDFVLKLDTDALVIAPFARKLHEAFSQTDRYGVLGTLGDSCCRERRHFFDDAALKQVEWALNISSRLKSDYRQLDNHDLVYWNLFYPSQWEDFRRVCEIMQSAISHGYKGVHCQGGSYAISRTLIEKLHDNHLYDKTKQWAHIPFAEDRLMGLCCTAVGLEVGDYSDRGQPFGVQALGLAYPPQDLIDRGYSIIHSVRTDTRLTELAVRTFFAERRT